MSADQREPVVVAPDLADGSVPAIYGVAGVALRSAHVPAMDVGVTVAALAANIGEDGLDVTLRATDALVHAAQRISCLVVIEFRNLADRTPSAKGVAVLAGDVQVSVRTARRRHGGPIRRGLLLLRRRGGGGHEQQSHRRDQQNQRQPSLCLRRYQFFRFLRIDCGPVAYFVCA